MTTVTRHVACTSDGAYLPFCFTMLRSLFVHGTAQPVTVHFLAAPDLDDACRDALQRLVASFRQQLAWHVIPDERVAGLPAMRGVPRLPWYRVLLPGLLPDVDRVLYLDADVLVVDQVDPLWDVDLAGHPLAAVPNVLDPGLRRQLLPVLGLRQDARYFNSGVMVMDLARMRATGFTERVMAHGREYGARFRWGDQDALNALFSSDYRQLHPRWNCMNSLFYFSYAREVFDDRSLAEARQTPAILHFEGPANVKPWNAFSTHPRRKEYLRELRASVAFLPLSPPARVARRAWYVLPGPVRRVISRLSGRSHQMAPEPLP